MRRPLLSDARRDLVTGVFVAVATGTAAVLAVLWCVAALAVGSVDLARRLGGL